MVAMKHLFAILLVLMSAILIPLSPRRTTASAEEPIVYAVADSPNVWFYSAENEESGLFLLPYTYYVKVLRRGTLYCAVQYLDDAAPYKSISGFCKTEDLTFVDFVPQRPFLKREITVSYAAENVTGTWMGKGAFDKVQKTFVYLGTSYLGTARFYYVYADGVFDYVPATGEVLFELNTDYLESVSGKVDGDLNGEADKTPAAGLSGGQIAIICVAAAALAVIAMFVLRGKKAPPLPEDF